MGMIRKVCCVCIGLGTLFLVACAKPEIVDGVSLESASVTDSSLLDPGAYLVSVADSLADTALVEVPVAVAFHGFSASTYEWIEYKRFSDSIGASRFSLPLLGGHGRDYSDFKNASWEDWLAEPLQEYRTLSERGYQHLDLVCSSTGCPLILKAFQSGKFKGLTPPRNLIMIDPIIAPSPKLLTIVDIVGPVIQNVKSSCTDIEMAHWYCNRPQEALDELMELLSATRRDLEDGITAPLGTQVLVYKSKQDGSADPISALMIYQGLRESDGSKVDVRLVDSKIHVFTRSIGRKSWTAEDDELRLRTYLEMTAELGI